MTRIQDYSQTLKATATRPTVGRDGIKPLVQPPTERTAAPIPALLTNRPAETADASFIEQRFRRLASEWKEATKFMSSNTSMVMHPAYQQIIGMGPSALPLLIAELRRDPDHWFAALKSISADDPVPPEDRGKVQRMVQAWLVWGEKHGY